MSKAIPNEFDNSCGIDSHRNHVRTSFWLPGLCAAMFCGFVYYGFGTQWTLRPRPSLHVHHTLTASAWLHGRTYVTEGEILRQFMVNSLIRAGSAFEPKWSDEQVRAAFEVSHGNYLRSIGVPEKQIPEEVAGWLRRAYLDWVRIDNRYYAYWPPVPAALMVPLVALLGTNFSDVVVANVLGAITVFFVHCMLIALRRHWPQLSPRACLGLTLFYGLGTCHMFQASAGQVWLITQLTATLFLVVAILLAIATFHPNPKRQRGAAPRDAEIIPPPVACAPGSDCNFRPFLFFAGAVALALGFLSRNTILGTVGFFVILAWAGARKTSRPARSLLWVVGPAAIVLLLAIGAQLVFNHVRFGHPLDFGQARLAIEGGNPMAAPGFSEHGQFDLHYVPRNVWCYFLNPTLRQYPAYDPAHEGVTFDPDGNSLFLISPLFLYLFAGWRRWPRGLAACAIVGTLPVLTALILFHNTGWYQFGPRYILDVLPFLLMFVAFGMRSRLTCVSAALIGLSILINAWGTHRFILEQG